MKKYFNIVLIILLSFILLFFLSGCDKSDEDILNEKVKEELTYLDLEILSIINSLNNITIQNYEISTKEISLRRL